VYCKDGKRPLTYEHTSFTFLGFTFRARKAIDRNGERFTAFLPAISKEALKKISGEVRRWRLHRQVGRTCGCRKSHLCWSAARYRRRGLGSPSRLSITTAGWLTVLLRLAYLGLMNTFALLRMLPRSDRDKDVEILALRHQITLLHRQLGDTRVRFTPADRAFLAALLHRLPR
jgi:hypothetical protein